MKPLRSRRGYFQIVAIFGILAGFFAVGSSLFFWRQGQVASYSVLRAKAQGYLDAETLAWHNYAISTVGSYPVTSGKVTVLFTNDATTNLPSTLSTEPAYVAGSYLDGTSISLLHTATVAQSKAIMGNLSNSTWKYEVPAAVGTKNFCGFHERGTKKTVVRRCLAQVAPSLNIDLKAVDSVTSSESQTLLVLGPTSNGNLVWTSTGVTACRLYSRAVYDAPPGGLLANGLNSSFTHTTAETDLVYTLRCDAGATTHEDTVRVQKACPQQVLFVTSDYYRASSIGGLTGADQKCNDLASTAKTCGGTRTWKAVMSDATESAITRIPIAGPVFNNHRLGRSEIAANSAEFWNPLRNWPTVGGQPVHGYDEYGRFLCGRAFVGCSPGTLVDPPWSMTPAVAVQTKNEMWTGTFTNGTKSLFHCSNWSSNAGNGSAGGMREVDTDRFYDGSAALRPCTDPKRIYCMNRL